MDTSNKQVLAEIEALIPSIPSEAGRDAIGHLCDTIRVMGDEIDRLETAVAKAHAAGRAEAERETATRIAEWVLRRWNDPEIAEAIEHGEWRVQP